MFIPLGFILYNLFDQLKITMTYFLKDSGHLVSSSRKMTIVYLGKFFPSSLRRNPHRKLCML